MNIKQKLLMGIDLTFKNVLRILTLITIGSYLIFSCYYSYTNDAKPTYVDCGVIKSMSIGEEHHRYSKTDLFYINIVFEKSGFRTIKSNPETFFQRKKGDRMCYNLYEDTTFFHDITILTGRMVWFIFGIVGIIWFIYYLLPKSWL